MDTLTPSLAFSAIRISWFAFVLFWIWMARNAKPTARRESIASRATYLALIFIAFLLLFMPPDIFVLPRSPLLLAVAVALDWAGVLFAIWARAYLGSNWSATVTIKKDHELVRTGPYALVRHPIYSGILLGWAGIVLAVDHWQGLVSLALVCAAFHFKSRTEERLMTEQFGAQYDDYRRTTRALIPYLI